VPTKGDMFTKVIQFLRDLGIVDKCEEEGWNGLSDKILQTLRVHFRNLIPYRFQPGQQSQIGWAANSSLAPVTSDTDTHRPERSMLSHERVEEIQDMDIDNTPSIRTPDPKALPRLAANGLIKIKWPDVVSVPYFDGHIGDMLFCCWTKYLYPMLDPAGAGVEANLAMASTPSPPQALLVSENLFYNIKVYFENSCRNMILDGYGTLLTPNGAELHNDLCNDFDSYCFTATMLIEKGLHVEFRRALSKASALVEQILRAEHPRTLACFLEVFIHLIQTGLPEVTSFLRDFIKRMSAKVTRKGHPWGQICRLLGELDSESLDQAMAQIWKCTTDTFDSELGTFSRLAVSVRLDYIKRVYGITNYLEEERLLRDLLAQFGGIPRLPTPRVMLNLAHNLNRQGRHDEAEEMALEVLSLLQEYEIYARRIVERIESLKIVSRSQFNQGKTLAAEQTMREAIRMIVDQWGIQHSWVPEFMNVLEGWLRGWGWEEDANTLRGEIEELMGKDDIDEQLDGVQGLLC
jgi:hypothetical protein